MPISVPSAVDFLFRKQAAKGNEELIQFGTRVFKELAAIEEETSGLLGSLPLQPAL